MKVRPTQAVGYWSPGRNEAPEIVSLARLTRSHTPDEWAVATGRNKSNYYYYLRMEI